jgi:hypothetical protein
MTRPARLIQLLAAALLVVLGTACGGDTPASPSGEDTTTVPPVEAVPRGQALIEGLPVITILGPLESDAGEAPLFRWSPVDGAARYSLAVLGPDGPLWAWQGEETDVYLGGLPFERPPGWAGPVIVPGTCWSVVALDTDGHVVAVSELLPVSPAESPGHVCIPGGGGGAGA